MATSHNIHIRDSFNVFNHQALLPDLLRQGHTIDDQIGLLGALAVEGVMVDVVGSGVAGILVLHIQESALRASAAQGQCLLVVVEIVEGRSKGGATDNIHLVCLLHVPRYKADVILTNFFLLT